MITVLNVRKTVSYLNKCVFVTCGMVMGLLALAFMHVVRRIHHLGQHLQIWKLQNVNGWLMMDNSLIQNKKDLFFHRGCSAWLPLN